MRPLKILSRKINRDSALKGRYAYFCKEDIQYEDDELNMELKQCKSSDRFEGSRKA